MTSSASSSASSGRLAKAMRTGREHLRASELEPIVVGALWAAMIAVPLFRSTYLPLIDWSNHLALIEMFRRELLGEDLPCVQLGTIPGPYVLYYVLTAFVSTVLGSTLMGAKLVLGAAIWALYPIGRYLGRVVRANPSLAVFAPLAAYGYGFGYGFVTFVFSLPVLLAAIARLLDGAKASSVGRRRYAITAAVYATLVCSHGLSFLTFVSLAGLFAVVAAVRARSARPLIRVGLDLVPAMVLALGILAGRDRSKSAGFRWPERFFSWRELERLAWEWKYDLFDRGSESGRWLMSYLLVIFVVIAAVAIYQRLTERGRGTGDVAEGVGALAFVPGLYLFGLAMFGPETLFFPMEVWRAFNRFATTGVSLLFLVLPLRLGRWGRPVLLASALLAEGHYAWELDRHMHAFDEEVRGYDEVRALVGAPSSVVGYSEWHALPVRARHEAMTGLYFYHMLDGAEYCAFTFTIDLYPIVRTPECRVQRQGFPPNLAGPPETLHEVIVVRGQGMERKMDTADAYRKVGSASGWTVYRQK